MFYVRRSLRGDQDPHNWVGWRVLILLLSLSLLQGSVSAKDKDEVPAESLTLEEIQRGLKQFVPVFEYSSANFLLEEKHEYADVVYYESKKPVGIAILPIPFDWRIMVQAESVPFLHEGFGGDLKIAPVYDPRTQKRKKGGSIEGYSGEAVSIVEAPQVLAEGIAAPPVPDMFEINQFHLRAEIPVYCPSANYHGRIKVWLEIGGVKIPLKPIDFHVHHKSFSAVMVLEGGQMDFGTVMQGINTSLNTPHIVIKNNTPGLKVRFRFDHLRGLEGEIPVRNFALNFGMSPTAALNEIAGTSLGNTEFVVTFSECGRHDLYLAGKVSIDFSMPAGMYNGLIQITCTQ